MTDDEIDQALEQADEPTQSPEEETDEEEGGLLDMNFEGSSKPLEHYESSPYRSLAGVVNGDDIEAEELQERGEKHLARGVDGFVGSVVESSNPIVDVLIGLVLVTVANYSDGDLGSGEDSDYHENTDVIGPDLKE